MAPPILIDREPGAVCLVSTLAQHLGYKLKEYTPTFRGYDSFLGYYNSQEDYFTHFGPTPADHPGGCAGLRPGCRLFCL